MMIKWQIVAICVFAFGIYFRPRYPNYDFLTVEHTSNRMIRSTPPNPYNVAICMWGRLRVTKETVSTFEDFVYTRLGKPDIFVNVKETKTDEIQRRFQRLVTNITYREDPVYQEEIKTNTYSKCMDDYREEQQSNWIQGWPNSFGGTTGTGFRQVYGWEQCGKSVRESEAIREKQYDWIIFTRSDFIHVSPHPVPHSPNTTYIPLGMDWEGINDRHTIHPRVHANIRFDVHGMLLNGTFNCSWLSNPKPKFTNLETFILRILQNTQTPVERYQPTAFLTCVDASCEWKRMKYENELQL